MILTHIPICAARYVDRFLKKLYLEYERECPTNLKLQLHQLGKNMDSLVLPEDPQPPDDSDGDRGSDSNTSSDGGDAEVHVMLAEHILNADAQDLAGVLDAGGLGEGGVEKLVGDGQNARAAAGAAAGGAGGRLAQREVVDVCC
ncbi:hypothetical protein QJQ45_005117 [Haematococcus lacustris]|nr:hypothetical protein QJQ45_005117 [Haematococcus lacustris]